jgi:hypothetical protein
MAVSVLTPDDWSGLTRKPFRSWPPLQKLKDVEFSIEFNYFILRLIKAGISKSSSSATTF